MTDTPASRAATLHDVAREAGVSLATASRVLNGSARKVADSYRERVEAAAAKLGYSANMSAQATARGTSATLALLVADIADPYFSQIAAGVARAADEERLIMTIGITEREAERETRLVRALRGQRPRGIVLAASRSARHHSPALTDVLRDIEAAGGTVVSIGAPADGMQTRTLTLDNFGSTRELGQALSGIGYRNAILIGAAEGLVTSDERLAGFQEGFVASGGNAPLIVRGGFSRDSGYTAMASALEQGVHPGTLVFGITDVVAFGAMSAVRAAGLEVGTDIAIAGFGDIDSGRDIVPGLTTVHAPLEKLGEEAVRAVVAETWTPPAPLAAQVILRDSTPPVDAA
ncbi:LacI family DNA-binding transcriptional regulator [Microbacterium amylolyticum]|uniref:LacI family transcriptional regulator n=1 Tax=Microbacterium amylolyticum TaxID=936337 RepID=A0ABS4ZIA9_9MICO|nr:LacI family DNA-binding transcriptional regulator [Microbacterium amylolyticum]MBP2437015.1 LacI family transcriptional regulator [Microbacterium amylolyticum]